MIRLSTPIIEQEEKQAVMAVLDSGILAQGPKVAELEERFKELSGAKFAIATSSGTTALHIALLAHGIGAGDEVVTASFTFIASANSVLFTGAIPTFADIDDVYFHINNESIEKVCTAKTKAIMPVHLYGQMCDMDAICELAEKRGLAIIQDAAQSVGATFRGKPIGAFGTACYSLYATKNIMSGEGGIIVTNDAEVADRCKLLRSHGMRVRYHHDMLGFNFRLSDLHAAIGVEQTRRLAMINETRARNAQYLSERIKSCKVPAVRSGALHVWHQYTIQVPQGMDRDRAIEKLKEKGVEAGVYYPIPAHQQPYMMSAGKAVSLPVTERLSKSVLSLPVHPKLTMDELATIVEAVNAL